jgi:hypothetical protein
LQLLHCQLSVYFGLVFYLLRVLSKSQCRYGLREVNFMRWACND